MKARSTQMTRLRYRLTAPLTVRSLSLGQFLVPAGTILIPATTMSGPERIALAEEISGRIVRSFPSEIEREFWIAKNAKVEI